MCNRPAGLQFNILQSTMGRRRLRDVLTTLSHEMLWARVGYRAGSR